MKKSQLTKIIREEINRLLNEGIKIRKGYQEDGSPIIKGNIKQLEGATIKLIEVGGHDLTIEFDNGKRFYYETLGRIEERYGQESILYQGEASIK